MRIRSAALLSTIVTGAVLGATTDASAATFDCRTDGDDRCIVRIEGVAYWYQFAHGRPTADVRLHPKQQIEDDRYIDETGPYAPWDGRFDGDQKVTGRLGGVRYVFPFEDGSPLAPYVSAWQG